MSLRQIIKPLCRHDGKPGQVGRMAIRHASQRCAGDLAVVEYIAETDKRKRIGLEVFGGVFESEQPVEEYMNSDDGAAKRIMGALYLQTYLRNMIVMYGTCIIKKDTKGLQDLKYFGHIIPKALRI